MSKKITQILAEHRGGFIATRIDEMMHALVEAVQAAGKKGAITIKLEATPHGKGNREVHLRIVPTMKLPPDPDTMDESIWYGVRGGLQREDPDQREMFGPKAVGENAAAEAREKQTGAAG
jgi:hypothetical protein